MSLPWNNTTNDIASRGPSTRYETPLGAQQKADAAEEAAKAYSDYKLSLPELPISNGSIVERHIRSENVTERTIAQKAVTRSKIGTGAVGWRELDPSLVADIDDVIINANFDRINEEFTDISINVRFPPPPLIAAIGNGIADDTNAIQAVINRVMSNGGGSVRIPHGYKFLVSSQILIDTIGWDGTNLCIKGGGMITVPQGNIPSLNTDSFTGINGTSVGGLIRINTADDQKQRVSIRDINFYKPDDADTQRHGTFINVATWRNVSIKDCSFKGGDIQVLVDRSYGCEIVQNKFTLFNQAIWLRAAANTTVIERNTIREGRHGIRVDSVLLTETTLGVRIINNYIESLTNEAIACYGVRQSSITGNYFEAVDQNGQTFFSYTGFHT